MCIQTNSQMERQRHNRTLIHVPQYRYVISLTNSMFDNHVDCIFPMEHEMKDTTDTARYTSYLDLHLYTDNRSGQKITLYYKRCDFNCLIVSFPFMQQHFSNTCIWRIYISVDMIFKSCFSHEDFIDRVLVLTRSQ